MLRVPFTAGDEIEYCGEKAIIVSDNGGARIDVLVDGDSFQTWYYDFEGEKCSLVIPASTTKGA
jgi:hypothetical protein